MTERARRKCPHCGARALERRISGGAGVVFRGPGFHCNDYPSRPHRKIPDREFVDMATAAAKERD